MEHHHHHHHLHREESNGCTPENSKHHRFREFFGMAPKDLYTANRSTSLTLDSQPSYGHADTEKLARKQLVSTKQKEEEKDKQKDNAPSGSISSFPSNKLPHRSHSDDYNTETKCLENLFSQNMQVNEKQKGKEGPSNEPLNPTNPMNVLENAIATSKVEKATKSSPFEKIVNFRDICEGEPLRIKKGIIFRSGAIHLATDNDFEILTKLYGIKTTIDFRSTDEVRQHPSPTYEKWFPSRREYLGKRRCRISCPLWKVTMNFKILLEAKKYRTVGQIGMAFARGDRELGIKLLLGEMNEIKLPGMYKCFIKYVHAQIRQALEIISDTQNHPILIHCSLGKDRTGVMSALISDILGMKRNTIVDQYSKSADNLFPVRKEVIENLKRYYFEEWLADSPKEVMEETFDWIEETYGSVPELLTQIGFDSKKQKQLRKIMLITSAP